MMKHFEPTYQWAKGFVKDKDKAITSFMFQMLDRTQAMFKYENMPETMNSSQLENILQQKGNALITEVDGNLYALTGGYSGEPDVYGNPTQYTVSNVALNLSKTFTIGEGCVLMKNDFHEQGILPIIGKYAALMLDSDISLNTIAVLSRIAMLISAPDEKTRASAEQFINKILDGEFTIIGENQFFDGVKLQTPNASNQQRITDFIELMQYYRASMFNELGLQSNYNMKRERLNTSEVAMNTDILLPLADNMLLCREEAVTKINEMFGTEIIVDFGSSWKTTHEEEEQITEFVMTESGLHEVDETETEESEETDGETSESTDSGTDNETSSVDSETDDEVATSEETDSESEDEDDKD